MKWIQIGSRVRITDGAALDAALRGPGPSRPEPNQMLWAGRESNVVGYRRTPEDGSLYVLKDAPGLWPQEWIDPI